MVVRNNFMKRGGGGQEHKALILHVCMMLSECFSDPKQEEKVTWLYSDWSNTEVRTAFA